MSLSGSTLLWYSLAIGFFFMAGGIVIGVVVDRDTVINQIFKKIRYKKGSGDLIIDGNQELPVKKSWRERREEKRKKRQEAST